MTKKRTETKQNTSYNNTNTYGWMTPPDTDDVKALRGFQFQADPSVGYVYGNARNQVANSFNNPLGGVYTPQMRDSVLRASLSDLSQKEGQARSEAYNQLQGARFGQASTVAALTSPRLIQTGSSGTGQGTGTTVQSGGMLEALIGGAATGAAA